MIQPQRRNPPLCQRIKVLHCNRGQLSTVDHGVKEFEGFQPCQLKRISTDSVESTFQFERVGLKW